MMIWHGPHRLKKVATFQQNTVRVWFIYCSLNIIILKLQFVTFVAISV